MKPLDEAGQIGAPGWCARGLLLGAVVAFTPAGAPAQTVTPTPAEPAPRAPAERAPQGTSEVRVSKYMTVDLFVRNDSIVNVLEKLAVQARRSIVPSKNVDVVVNATISGAPFEEALDALLRPNGLGYHVQGEFIFVYTAEELAALNLGSGKPITRVIHLDYVLASEAVEFVRPLLSASGHIAATRDSPGSGPDADGGGRDLVQQFNFGAGKQNEVYTPDRIEFSMSNSITVHDLPENADRIEAYLRQIDTRPSQVLLETTIVEMIVDEQNAFGVDFALITEGGFTDFFNFASGGVPLDLRTATEMGLRTSPTLSEDEGFIVSTPGNVGGGSANIRAGVVFGDVGIFVRALDQVSDVSVLSNPKVLVLNRQRAQIHVGRRVGYLETAVVENKVLQKVEFINDGIELDIRPYVLKDGRVRLELAPKVSDVTFTPTAEQSGVVVQVPTEAIETVVSHVLVPEGYTAVLGGMFREKTVRGRSQVPVLGDIPLVGAAFRGQDDRVTKTEVIFLIRPTIISDNVLADQGHAALEYAQRLRVGAREGLLPFSRDARCGRLNLKAERLAADGETDEALFLVRRSLELNPLQPDAIRILEGIVGSREWWPTPSMLDRIIEQEYDRQQTGREPPPAE